MSMGLSATDHTVVDLRPHDFGAWIEGDDDVDALILDLESPQLAVAAVTNLRGHGKLAPVLLVSSDRPGWDSDDLAGLPSAAVLPLPITRPALLSSLDELLLGTWATYQPPVTTGRHREVAAAFDELRLDTADLLSDDDELLGQDDHLDTLISAIPVTEAPEDYEPPPRYDPMADRPARWLAVTESPVPERLPEPEPPAPSRPSPSPKPAGVVTSASAERIVDEHPPLTAVPRTRRSTRLLAGTSVATRQELEALRPKEQPAPPPVVLEDTSVEVSVGESTADLVRRLTARLREIYGVRETADVIVVDAVERAGADAGALLVPDDGSWRVAAGVGLRPLEMRYELHAESWLVQNIGRSNLGAIVEDSDIAREQLQGAPLASWRHLLTAPVPQVDAILLLARRDDPPFDEADLAVLATLGSEAGPLLMAALETRSLARSLWEFRDEPDLPR